MIRFLHQPSRVQNNFLATLNRRRRRWPRRLSHLKIKMDKLHELFGIMIQCSWDGNEINQGYHQSSSISVSGDGLKEVAVVANARIQLILDDDDDDVVVVVVVGDDELVMGRDRCADSIWAWFICSTRMPVICSCNLVYSTKKYVSLKQVQWQ
jgi:hypothetical protein